MPGRRSFLIVVSLLAALLCLPAVGSAAIRYAEPGGVKTGVCNPTACDLARAVNLAVDGDQVIVRPGTYKPGEQIKLDSAATVGGEAGSPPPVVQLTDHFVREGDAGAILHDLRIELVEPTIAYAVTIEAGTLERVYASTVASAGACQISQGTILDSVCLNGFVVGGNGGGSSHIVLRNDTATDVTMGSSGNTATTIDGANLILRNDDPGFAEGADLGVDVSSGSSAAISLRDSDYAIVNTTASSGTDFTFTAPGTEGNRTAPPQFVDLATGDLHELPGSPTVDAGVADPLIGASDLDRQPRSQPGCIGGAAVPDIGAYELTPTVPCPTAGTPAPTSPPPPSPIVTVPGSIELVKVKLDRQAGTATLLAKVSGPGALTLTGKGIAKRTASAGGAGVVKLAIAPKGKAKKLLVSAGRVAVKAKITFTPAGEAAIVATRKLVLHRSHRG